jgi:hypothetical protein
MLGEELPSYEPSVNALIDGLENIPAIPQHTVASAVTSSGRARTKNGRELHVAELPPRVQFDRPLASQP